MAPKVVFGAAFLAAIGGVVAMVAGMTTGNLPLAFAGCAVVMGAHLAPAVADWWAVQARIQAADRRNGEDAASVQPVHDVQPDIKETLDDLKAYYARSNSALEGGGRYQALVASADEPLLSAIDPPGFHRWH